MTDRNFIVREARERDSAVLGAIITQVYSALEGFPTPAEQPHYYELVANIGLLAKRPGACALVAESAGTILGGVVVFSDMAHYGAGAVAQEQDASGFRLLAVAPSARGQGIGGALIEACIARANANGHASVVIHTTKAMCVAQGMYERLGFRRVTELDFMQQELHVLGFRLELPRMVPMQEHHLGEVWRIFSTIAGEGRTYVQEASTTETDFVQYWCDRGGEQWVALRGANVVGAYTVRANQVGRGAHVATASFVVDAISRGCGIGKRLGTHALFRARALGFSAMQFNFVVATNVAAVRAWRALGFVIVGTLPGAFRDDGGRFTDAHVMWRSLG